MLFELPGSAVWSLSIHLLKILVIIILFHLSFPLFLLSSLSPFFLSLWYSYYVFLLVLSHSSWIHCSAFSIVLFVFPFLRLSLRQPEAWGCSPQPWPVTNKTVKAITHFCYTVSTSAFSWVLSLGFHSSACTAICSSVLPQALCILTMAVF